MDYHDLTLTHWPTPNSNFFLDIYMEQIADAKTLGLTKRTGFSSSTGQLLEQVISILDEGVLVNIQVERHPDLRNQTLLNSSNTNNIPVTCYLQNVCDAIDADPVLETIAKKPWSQQPSNSAGLFYVSRDVCDPCIW